MRKEQYIAFLEEYTRRELNARYREIPLKDTTSRLLRKYFNILGGDELYMDIKHAKPLDREIIDVALIGGSTDPFMETKRSQQGQPYYVPDKKHLLEYSNPFYCEDTPEKRRLRGFLKECCGLSDERETAVFEELL